MHKAYDPNLKPPKNGTLVPANVVVVKHLKNGMDANLFPGSIACGNGTVTITVRELKLSVSVTEADMLQAFGEGGDKR